LVRPVTVKVNGMVVGNPEVVKLPGFEVTV
jgi:hypothetical protein